MSEYGESQAERDYRIKKENDKLRRNYDNKQASVAYYQEVEKKMDEDWKRKLEEEALRPKLSKEQQMNQNIKTEEGRFLNYLIRLQKLNNDKIITLTSKNKKSESIVVKQSSGKEISIDVPSFHIHLKFEYMGRLDGEFFIFRWGNWRRFDPVNYMIEVDLNTTEIGINPFTDKPYKNLTDQYHTVLRKLKNQDKTSNVLYYDIRKNTFYKEENKNCNEVFKYQKGGNFCGFNSMLERDWKLEEIDKLSKAFHAVLMLNDKAYRQEYINDFGGNNKSLIKENEEDRNYLEFMNPFVNEFGGVMDEMLKYGYSFILSDERNLAEELIWGNDPDKLQTRNNYRRGGGSGEEVLYESIKLSDEDTMIDIIFKMINNIQYHR